MVFWFHLEVSNDKDKRLKFNIFLARRPVETRKRNLDEQKGSQSCSDGDEETKKSKTDGNPKTPKKEIKDEDLEEIQTKTPKEKKGKSIQLVFLHNAICVQPEGCCIFLLGLCSKYVNTCS